MSHRQVTVQRLHHIYAHLPPEKKGKFLMEVPPLRNFTLARRVGKVAKVGEFKCSNLAMEVILSLREVPAECLVWLSPEQYDEYVSWKCILL